MSKPSPFIIAEDPGETQSVAAMREMLLHLRDARGHTDGDEYEPHLLEKL